MTVYFFIGVITVMAQLNYNSDKVIKALLISDCTEETNRISIEQSKKIYIEILKNIKTEEGKI